MSAEDVAQILSRIDAQSDTINTLVAENQTLVKKVTDLEREHVMARRHSTKPYYTTAELQTLTGKPTIKAVHAWARRRGIPSHGHNQWDRPTTDTILGIA